MISFEMISQIPMARLHLDRGEANQTPWEHSSQDCDFCWRKGGVWDKQSGLCWKKTNMFVVPLVHIFPNIVQDLENSGCPALAEKLRALSCWTQKPLPSENSQAATHPAEKNGPVWTGRAAVHLGLEMGEWLYMPISLQGLSGVDAH